MRSNKHPSLATSRWKTAEELQQLLAERAGEHPVRVSVCGEPGNWDATLLVNQIGNSDRKARFKAIVGELRRNYDLRAD